MENLEFQLLNWYAEDVEMEVSDDDNDDEDKTYPSITYKYYIKLFGRDMKGKSISVTVNGFTPHFYIRILRKWNQQEIDKFRNTIISKLSYKIPITDIQMKFMKKKDFWGFNNNTEFSFMRLAFPNERLMKQVARILSNVKFFVPGFHQRKFKLYESNIIPFLRFAHLKNILPAGWIQINKYKLNPFILPSKCDIDIETHWMDIVSINKDDIAPFVIASFDLECTSSDGDFPVAKKDYRKVATDLYNLYQESKKQKLEEYKIRDEVEKNIIERFEKTHLIPKIPMTKEQLSQTIMMHFEHLCNIIRGDKTILHLSFKRLLQDCFRKQNPTILTKCLEFKEKITKEGLSSVGMRKSMTTWMKKCFTNNYDNLNTNIVQDVDDTIDSLLKIMFGDKDGIISIINDKLCGFLPPLYGDEIIQIGMTIHKYGEKECFRKVILNLGTCEQLKDIEVIECKTEEEMLLRFSKLVNEIDPDIMTGYNIFGFDFAYLHDRVEELGCGHQFYQIGRLKEHTSKYKESKLSSSALGDNLLKYIDMEGRSVIDLMKVIQREHKLDSFKLDAVASHFMGMNKHDVSPADIFKFYKGTAKDRSIIADYCIQDCVLCNKLIMKLEIVANNVGMANVCSVPFSFIFMRGQGIKIFSLVAKECKEQGYLIPTKTKNEETEEIEEGYEGAIVLEPKKGIYIDTPISVLDYASLYPSSMISENLSHDCIILDDKYDNLPNTEYLDVTYDLYEGVGDEKIKVGEKVCRFVQPKDHKKGIIPNILMHLLKNRKLTRKRIGLKKLTFRNGEVYEGFYKDGSSTIQTITGEIIEINKDDIHSVEDLYNEFQKATLDGLQLAYKITANSLYGQIGAKTSPIYLKDIAACTTATGRKMIMLAKDFCEREMGGEIIYGDTDSIFVSFPTKDSHGNLLKGREALASCRELGIKASESIKPLLKYPHDLEWEKMFWPFILFSKKRYVANKYEHDLNKYKQVSMGIVLKRRDNASIVKKIYGGAIDIILNDHDIKKSVDFVKHSIQQLIEGTYPMEDLVITKTLKAHYKDPTRIAHKVLAERMKERSPGSAPQVNDRVPYIYITTKNDRKQILQGDRIEHPDYIRETKLQPDYEFYITNQVMNPVCQLFSIVLDQIEGNKKSKEYWEEIEEKLRNDHKTHKQIKEKLADMQEQQVKELLFEPFLKKLKNKKNGQREITEWFIRT